MAERIAQPGVAIAEMSPLARHVVTDLDLDQDHNGIINGADLPAIERAMQRDGVEPSRRAALANVRAVANRAAALTPPRSPKAIEALNRVFDDVDHPRSHLSLESVVTAAKDPLVLASATVEERVRMLQTLREHPFLAAGYSSYVLRIATSGSFEQQQALAQAVDQLPDVRGQLFVDRMKLDLSSSYQWAWMSWYRKHLHEHHGLLPYEARFARLAQISRTRYVNNELLDEVERLVARCPESERAPLARDLQESGRLRPLLQVLAVLPSAAKVRSALTAAAPELAALYPPDQPVGAWTPGGGGN